MANEKPKLTPVQAEAAKLTGKNVLVSAGAGTGKTRVLVERFLHLVTTRQALVTEILALTFTEKAANEMKGRILKALNIPGFEGERRSLESAYISTIHAFAARLLKEHPLEAGLDPDFRVIESEESDFLQEQAAGEALELCCVRGTPIFELTRLYGERTVMDGLRKIFALARHEGKPLQEFFSRMKQVPPGPAGEELERRLLELLRELGEPSAAEEGAKLLGNKTWDWETVERFKVWRKGLTKRDKKGETGWKQVRNELYPAVLAARLEPFVKPRAEAFEGLALRFEEIYEAAKRDRAVLDFDDLQMWAIRLFKKPGAMHEKLLRRYREKFRHILVDEFQDTNALQFEFIELLSRGDNLFLVGDYQQSIYGFRGAEPRLFRGKEEEYKSGQTGFRRSLVRNFRSEEPVLDFVNTFFEGLWEEEGFRFDKLEAEKTVPQRKGPQVELLTVETGNEETTDLGRMREADWIAGRIRELHDEGTDYGEIAILFQAMTSLGIYEQALKNAGIPYFAVSGRGFYHQPEIRDMVSFLSFLENPLADIPLAASLRSPIFQVRDDTLFWLSRSVKKPKSSGESPEPLYHAVKIFEDIPEIPEDEKAKLRFFKRTAEACLPLKDRLRLTELLDWILSETSYELHVLADPQGVRRYANLKKLISLAREFEAAEPVPLGAFLRTVRRLQRQEAEEAEAQIEAEESGRVVRLLSIHKAKGLEYPVVFVADTGRKQNSRDSKRIIGQVGRGYALQVWNEASLEWEKPESWMALNDGLNRKDKEERKRLFYVATTRAKNRLVLTGAYSPTKAEKERYDQMTSWMEWLTHAPEASLDHLHIHPCAEEKPKRTPLLEGQKGALGELLRTLKPRPVGEMIPSKADALEMEKELDGIFSRLGQTFDVPMRAIDLPVSAFTAFRRSPQTYRMIYEIGYPGNVSETINRTGDDGTEDAPEFSAADFGTRVHTLLEFLDVRSSEEHLGFRIAEIFRGAGEEEKKKAGEIVSGFMRSDLFARLKKAERTYRELPFVLHERHGVIHGVIDLLYRDKEGWHIVDYKTAEGNETKVRDSGYDFQVLLYAHALKRIAGEIPASASVYFLKNQFFHRIELTAGSFDLFAEKLRSLQEEILCFRAVSG